MVYSYHNKVMNRNRVLTDFHSEHFGKDVHVFKEHWQESHLDLGTQGKLTSCEADFACLV